MMAKLTPEEIAALEAEAAALSDKLEKEGKIVKPKGQHRKGSKGKGK
jgi:hypothetical protein